MRIFLAGATGAIGKALVPQLIDQGHEVLGIGRSGEGAGRLDIYDRPAVVRAVAEFNPDVVIHQLTALADFDLSANARIRVEGTRNLVDAALASGVRRMIAQSIAFAYEPGDGPADEATPLDNTTEEPRATTVSGVRALESAVAELPEHVILRYGLLYGPGTWYVPGGREATDGAGSFVHVHDAAAAAVQALTWPNGTVNIVDDDPSPGSAPGQRGATNVLARKRGWQPRFPSWRRATQ